MAQQYQLQVVMKMNKFHIILAYYERPKIVLNALNSILDITYPNFRVTFIDDGSIIKGEPIAREVCSSIIDKFDFYYIYNDIPQKIKQGGSIHGKYLNKTIYESDADHIIILCDDDSIYPNFLDNLNEFLNRAENHNKCYFYHNVVRYDSSTQTYKEGIERNDMTYSTNRWKTPINCNCVVDSSQVTFSKQATIDAGISYPYPQTSSLDAALFQKMFDKWGHCEYSGLISQLKSDNHDNMIRKVDVNHMYITEDGVNHKVLKRQ